MSEEAPSQEGVVVAEEQIISSSNNNSMQQEQEQQQQQQQQQELFLRQVAALRHSLEGQSVVTLGGNGWTAEAREPDRKQRLHNQLTLARQLRARLEQAAEEAALIANQADRLELLEDRTDDINTLVSLTQAVKQGYTLDRYEEYSSRNLRQVPSEVSAELKDRDIIVKHLIAMKDERENPLGAASSLAAAAVAHRTRTVSSLSSRGGVAAARPTKRARGSRKLLPPSSSSRAAASITDNNRQSDSESSSIRKPAAKRQAIAITAAAQQQEEYYEYHSSEDEEYTPEAAPRSPSGRRRRSSSAKRIKRRSVASRRCHDCKSSTTYFRRCHYWFLTGAKCSKTFCSKCLIFKYGCPSEENWDMNDPDWHCPSCLGTCLCSDCVKERKRALRKESNYHTRGARSSYMGL
eukprot:CAMPEP_0119006272 /NCGR_PEP_ID=MMETSP1176-20130426/2204_1 /TAXON_ID=265551 /ORGANISM="Synedropsis recta cf, Strain CCMP1620" /LENGTH=406 /DNA_ID=CAMNT_0006958171 /DNA_START=80 /DNA_END=1300 /DNA_ORIENTATION=+